MPFTKITAAGIDTTGASSGTGYFLIGITAAAEM